MSSGDLDAFERLAYEYCEDVSRQGVVYAEVRFVPQRCFTPEHARTVGYDGENLLHLILRTKYSSCSNIESQNSSVSLNMIVQLSNFADALYFDIDFLKSMDAAI